MHKLERTFCYFGDEKLRLKEHLESLGKEKVVWESFRTVDSISPAFGGKPPALSVELLFNSNKTLKEVKIVDRVKSITAKYDGSGKLVMDDWLLKHPESAETAKGYEQRLSTLLTYTRSLQNIPAPQPIKQLQKSSLAESPKQAFQPHAMKTEASVPAVQERIVKPVRHFGGRMGRPFFTPEQVKARNAEIDAFCKEKGIDFENHPPLHNLALKNLKRIVALCEEKHIPFTPYRNFLVYPFNSFSSNVKALEEHGVDPVKFAYALVFPAQNLSENLKTCAEQGRDAVEEALVPHLYMNSEKFRGFLKTYVPPEKLSPEEKEKKIIAILVKNGLEEKDIKNYVKKKAPETVERVIEICDNHNFDWKTHQIVFSYAPGTLNSNLDSCASRNADPVRFNLLKFLMLPTERFNKALDDALSHGIPQDYTVPGERENAVVEIMTEKGMDENDIKDYVKKHHPQTVKKIIEACEENGFGWKKHQIVFVLAPNTLLLNLRSCTSSNIDPVKFELLADLTLPNEKFNARLKEIIEKGIQPKVLSPEERRSKLLEILTREGVNENEVNDYIKKKSPETVEKIIGICNMHNLDWKTHQTVFASGPNVLESNLSLCNFNNVDPVKFSITSRLTLPRDDFKEYLKVLMAQKGLEFKEPEIQKDI
ncbi:hypothetical protein H0N98_02825 [Candidatus Micrarchaeota archaeon]|nr:hypothetical protein [Candidatus Micrarchaeota archaeon]